MRAPQTLNLPKKVLEIRPQLRALLRRRARGLLSEVSTIPRMSSMRRTLPGKSTL